jgi:hypothetical protein
MDRLFVGDGVLIDACCTVDPSTGLRVIFDPALCYDLQTCSKHCRVRIKGCLKRLIFVN